MWLQVRLAGDVAIRMAAKVMFEQRQWHHQRHDAGAVLADQLLHFLFFIAAQGAFEVATEVLQYIAVGATGGALFQGCHQLAEVVRCQFGHIVLGEIAEQLSEGFVAHRVGGHQQVLVA